MNIITRTRTKGTKSGPPTLKRELVNGEPPVFKAGRPPMSAKIDPAQSAFRNYPVGDDGMPIIDDDPLKAMFSSHGVQIVGNPEDSMPEEVAAFIAKNDFARRSFGVQLKEIPEGGNEETTTHRRPIKSFYRTIPTYEYIARHYGPGNYVFIITWHENDPETKKQVPVVEEFPFEISKKLEWEHLEFLRKRKIESAKMQNEEVARLRLDSQLNESTLSIGSQTQAPPVDPKENAKAYITEIAQAAELLGFKRNEQSGFSMEKMMPFLPLVGSAIGALVKYLGDSQASSKEQMNNILMLMLNQSKESNQQLLEVAKIQNGQGSGASAIKEFKDMVLSAMDMKELLNGNKETVADKIFGMAETVLPQMLALAAQSQQQRQMNPAFHMARAFVQTDPNVKQIFTDPAVRKQVITMWDDHYGWKQTDSILSVAGLERPVDCPREPSQELPSDQRSPAAVNESEGVEDGEISQ